MEIFVPIGANGTISINVEDHPAKSKDDYPHAVLSITTRNGTIYFYVDSLKVVHEIGCSIQDEAIEAIDRAKDGGATK